MTRKEWDAAMNELARAQRAIDTDKMVAQSILNKRMDELLMAIVTEDVCPEKKSPFGS